MLRFASARGHRPPSSTRRRRPRAEAKREASGGLRRKPWLPFADAWKSSNFSISEEEATCTAFCSLPLSLYYSENFSDSPVPLKSSVTGAVVYSRAVAFGHSQACVRDAPVLRARASGALWALASWRARVACRLGRFWGDIPRRAWSPLTSASLMMHRHAV